VSRLAEFVGQNICVCGLVEQQRIHNQVMGEPMKLLLLAEWTDIVETELFSRHEKNLRVCILGVDGRCA